MMKIFMTGATGFIGRAVVLRLLRDDHQVVAWARSPDRARDLLGTDVEVVRATEGASALASAMAGADAVINLAGEPIATRWTEKKRRALVESRVGATQALVDAMRAQPKPPKVLVSGSAVGFYGDRKDEVLDEQSSMGSDFLAELCRDWEGAAEAATSFGVRVVTLRTGVVLGPEGGALAKMLPPFELGLGGRLGSGHQFMPWIHLADHVEIVATALVDDRYEGALNGTAPEPATNREFTKTLASVLHRPAIFPVPATMLKLVFGDAATILLGGQRALPARLGALGFNFRFPDLDQALADIVGEHGVEIGPAGDLPNTPYLSERGAQFMLRQVTRIDKPIDEVFAFFSQAANLGVMTPPSMGFSIETPTPIQMREGAQIDYTIRLGPLPMKWRTEISRWDEKSRFVDVQLKGPYRSWSHEHRFRADGDGTIMEDWIYYAVPFGPLGRLAHRLFVAPMLKRIFAYRTQATHFRFGGRAAIAHAA